MHMLEQHQGKDHVSAQDQADENMAGSGSGVYLAEYKGEYMEVSMESANQLTVSTGALLVNGRFCIVDPAETLTVDNGSSGMTEYDLVCVHWKETTATQQVALAEGGTKEVSTTVEETELVIVKGDPASSGATDPEISQTTIRAGVGEAWVPFARITKDGLTPSVAFIVDKLVPESKFRTSIDQRINVESIFVGSKVCNAANRTSVMLFSSSQFEEMFGRAFNAAKDCVVPMNGDMGATGAHVDGCSYGTDSRGTGVFATFNQSVPAEIRINYIVVLGS